MKTWHALALLGLGVTAAVAMTGDSATTGSGGGGNASPPPSPGPWKDADAPRRIREIAAPLVAELGWPGFDDFLVAVAWIESRGNPAAGSDALDNAARGWFGIRPKSAKLEQRGLPRSVLKDPRYAVALAADYAHRLRNWDDASDIEWIALRRGWGLPSDVDEDDHPGYRKQFAKGLAAAGLWPAWMDGDAFGPDYDWPGFERVVELVGAGGLA